MDIYTSTNQKITARFYAVVTIVSLLLSAFPAAFFVAEAARTGVAVTSFDSLTVQVNEGVRLQAQVQDDGDKGDIAVVELTDNGAGGIFMNVNSNNCSSVWGSEPQSITVSSGDSNKNFCYKNATPGQHTVTAELFVNDQKIGDSSSIEVTVMERAPEDRKIEICHWNGNNYISQEPNINSLGNGHGNSGINQGDIIPPVAGIFPDGFNWDWGEELWNNDCQQPESLTITDPATDGEPLSGTHTFKAEYVDEDDDGDTMRWAIRDKTTNCDSGTTYAGGNITGWNDPSSFDGAAFETTVDMTTWVNGEYCFVVNPDGSGEELREFRTFFLENGTPEAPVTCSYAGEVISYTDPAYRKDGTTLVAASRRLVSAIESGVAPYSNFFGNEPSYTESDFFSLGLNGFVEYEFTDQVAFDQAGPDIAIWEITGGTAFEQTNEDIEVLVSEDGVSYSSLGNFVGDAAIDIAPANLNFVKYVKVVDQGSSNDDGYDVDAITIISGSCGDVPSTPICENGENLLVNGSFEEPEVESASLWGKFLSAATSWVTEKVSDDTSTTLELHRGWSGNEAAGGAQYAELDGDEPTRITQSVATIPGATYELSWAFAPRQATAAAENELGIEIDGTQVKTTGPAAGTGVLAADDWTLDSYEFEATGANTDISFLDLGLEAAGNGPDVGTFLDNTALCFVREPEPQPTLCTLKIVSDDTNTVNEKGGAVAEVLSYIHPSWTTVLADADWIWGDDGVVNPLINETQTFVNQFGWNGDAVLDATLSIAADNSFSASLNGLAAGESLIEHNFNAIKTYDVTGLINSGNNEFEVMVENFGLPGSNAESNPAGLYYELVINGEGENCEVPYVPEPEEPEYGPYCGDGEVNQNWEQCDSDTGCTDYCTLDNQCSAVPLMKITLDEQAPASESFDGMIYLGGADNPIPNGKWFLFAEPGDDPAPTTALAAPGLAVERAPGGLMLAVEGGNAHSHFDYAFGRVETKGLELGSLHRAPVPGWPLENSGNYVDVFAKDGDTALDFKFWLTNGNDGAAVAVLPGEEYDCPVQPEPDTYQISGYKYEVDGESTTPYPGWTIYASNGEGDPISTLTDQNGFYSFEVLAGDWTVYEELGSNWTQVLVEQDGDPVQTDADVEQCLHSVPTEESDYICDFYNTYEEPEQIVLGCTDETALNYNANATPGNTDAEACEYEELVTISQTSSSGGRPRVAGPTPLVLGASTSFCPLITDYMQMGGDNDSWEVTKLQMFLNIFRSVYGGTENPVTGFFGTITDANVKAFQDHYRSDILEPWYELGIVPHEKPTGFVYKTTLYKINSIVCPDEAVPPSFEGEDLTSNVDLGVTGLQD